MMTPVARRTYTDAEKAEALALYEEHGPREAAARLDIPISTVASWAAAANVRTRSLETKGDAVLASVATMEQRKLALAAGLMDDIAKLREQLFAPCIEKRPMVVSDGKDAGSHIEVAEVGLDRPSFTDQRAIMTSVAIAVDKVQILTGDVTERTEHVGHRDRDEVKARLGRVVEAQALRLVS